MTPTRIPVLVGTVTARSSTPLNVDQHYPQGNIQLLNPLMGWAGGSKIALTIYRTSTPP